MAQLRAVLAEPYGRLPDRRTWERRLARVPATLPAQIGCLGRALVDLVGAWAEHGRAVALDRPRLRAPGGVWHPKQRAALQAPIVTFDPQADWGKSGWHGWVDGWKLHLAAVVAGVFIPLAADLTRASVHAATVAPRRRREVPLAPCFVLGDTHYQTPGLHQACAQRGRALIAAGWTPAPPADAGQPVRAVCHALRRRTSEHLNEVIQDLFGLHGTVPTTGRLNTQRYVLGAIFVYQLTLWYRFEHNLPLNLGVKAFLRAA